MTSPTAGETPAAGGTVAETGGDPCPDCAVPVGSEHVDGCDVARCLATGWQRLGCGGEDHDCGRDVWTGVWPGVDDARRLDLWCFWGPDYGRSGWVPCTKDHPGARPDLNRLVGTAAWDATTGRWELPGGAPRPA